ncbi:serine protease 33-like isoform X2 [Palaemon carinicauda]|uniref:serine protease 33-like isoform X2 n=1 Tax=Palaemon carinicauda TaxID=392227 RepID=UPI0035B645F1
MGATESLVKTRDESSPKCAYPVRKIPVSGKTSLTLMSPNFPASYEYNTRCGWSLRPVSRSVIMRLNCDTFSVQDINDVGKCPDYLEVMDTRYCGSDPPNNITAPNLKRLKILFKSNGRDNYRGFRCKVEGVNRNTEECFCGLGDLPESVQKTKSSSNTSFPWAAAIVDVNTDVHFCSASVIFEDWLLTSASCVERIKYNKYNYEVVVGVDSVTSRATLGNVHQIKRVLIHPEYNSDKAIISGNDIGLVQLTEPINFHSEEVRPVCLQEDPGFELNDREADFAVWRTRSGNMEPIDKQESLLMSQTSCKHSYQDSDIKIDNSFICLSLRNHPSNCFNEGDLGGPLVIRSDSGRFIQVGVALHSSGCNNTTITSLPLIYTNVIKYMKWIKKSVELSDTCL